MVSFRSWGITESTCLTRKSGASVIIVHSASIVDCCNWTLSHSKDWTSKGNNWQKKKSAHVEYKQGKQPTWKSHNVQIFWLAFLPDTGSYFNILHVDSSKIGKLHELEYLLGQNGEQEMVFYKWRYKEGYWYTLEHKVLSKWKRVFFLAIQNLQSMITWGSSLTRTDLGRDCRQWDRAIR